MRQHCSDGLDIPPTGVVLELRGEQTCTLPSFGTSWSASGENQRPAAPSPFNSAFRASNASVASVAGLISRADISFSSRARTTIEPFPPATTDRHSVASSRAFCRETSDNAPSPNSRSARGRCGQAAGRCAQLDHDCSPIAPGTLQAIFRTPIAHGVASLLPQLSAIPARPDHIFAIRFGQNRAMSGITPPVWRV